MKKALLLLALLQIATITAAQNTGEKIITEQENILRLGILEVEYEYALSPNMTLVSQAGAAISAGFGGRRIGWVFDYTPYLGVSLRYYYNLQKRAITGRNTKYYSGNYVSFVTMAYFSDLIHQYEENEFFFGPAWGLQRDIGKGFQIGAEIGLGMGGPIDQLKPALHWGFTLGIRIN